MCRVASPGTGKASGNFFGEFAAGNSKFPESGSGKIYRGEFPESGIGGEIVGDPRGQGCHPNYVLSTSNINAITTYQPFILYLVNCEPFVY
jgi:hypothetical protein